MKGYFIGVDVGTASVRAGLFDDSGKLLSSTSYPLKIWNPIANYFEQSSDEIWKVCCAAVKDVAKLVNSNDIQGIGFDATCSLVVLGECNSPLTISPSGNKEQNIIMWMDHRAKDETKEINSMNHSAFKYVGGQVSIEMQLPKLMWLKKNIPATWLAAKKLMDLPDFLTWRATNVDVRSQCSVACKWCYIADSSEVCGWPKDLFEKVDVAELLDQGCSVIGSCIKTPGQPQGSGLSREAAIELGLDEGTPVGVSLIDAYAGALGLLSSSSDVPMYERLAIICGTSNCHMLISSNPLFVQGVWGPYSEVLLPGLWLLEGGQSATGKLVDHIVQTHPCYSSIRERLGSDERVLQELEKILHSLSSAKKVNLANLSQDIHIWPDFHGNRSPLADPNMKGMVCGLTLDASEENMALLYLATIQAICYGTRHIISAMLEKGARIGCLLLCGGLTKSDIFVKTMADSANLPVVIPFEQESVLLGAAMLGASASGKFTSLFEAMEEMGSKSRIIQPNAEGMTYHEKKYRVFLKMLHDQQEYSRLMNES